MTHTISVIVPVFNCKGYLEKCIESILNQSYLRIQLILVDDGSTDGSGEICDAFAAQDHRILVTHQPNGGVSKARNAGIELATEGWIMFVDSDDYVEADYCRRMLDAATLHGADIVIGRPTIERLPKVCDYDADEVDLLKRTCLANDETKFDYNIDGPWGKLFKRDLIENHHIRFPEILARSEDAWFCATAYEHAEKICYLNWFGYVHVEREGSMCRRFAPDAPEMLERILIENQKWVWQYHPEAADYEAALWHRVLPGIDECEKMYYLHASNRESLWKRMRSYSRFLNIGMVNQAIRALKIEDISKRQYKLRLVLYKLHLGWFFILVKKTLTR